MADTLPGVDFGFNDLRERMAQFTARFDEFIDRGRKKVLEERNAFRMNMAELEGNILIGKFHLKTYAKQNFRHSKDAPNRNH